MMPVASDNFLSFDDDWPHIAVATHLTTFFTHRGKV
jgi:hypothetical protein